MQEMSQTKTPKPKKEVIQLTPEIYVVRGADFLVSYTNCYNLAIKDEINAVVDTGATGDFEEVFPRESVSIIANSHYHMDHTRYNETFPNAKVWLHAADVPFLTDRARMSYCLGLDRYGPDGSEDIMREMFYLLKRVDHPFKDGQKFDFGKTKMVAVHAPGHTPGHCMFYFPNENILFSADVDLGKWGPGYGSPLSSLEVFQKSIDLVKEINPRLIVSGHEGVLEGNYIGMADRYAKTMVDREELIYSCLREPLDIEEILDLKQLVPAYPFRYTRIFIMIMIELHLERLMQMGRVQQLVDGRFVQI